MPMRSWFQSQVELLRALGWTVDLSTRRLALYPRAPSRNGTRPAFVLQYDVPVPCAEDVEQVSMARPYQLYSRRFSGARTFRSWAAAAATLIHEAREVSEADA